MRITEFESVSFIII